MIISEMPSKIWSLESNFDLNIDRSKTTVAEFLGDAGVDWRFGADSEADLFLYKEDVGQRFWGRLFQEAIRMAGAKPCISLIGESRELAPSAYLFARRACTLAVAPGKEFKRLFFASEWIDPQLEEWSRRLDRICWFARPTPERITIAQQLIMEGIPLDIFSRDKWPFQEWKGYADNEIEVSRRYRYRLVFENSCYFGYHSEKLFNGIRSGCITFYKGDKSLDLIHAEGAYLPMDIEVMQNRDEYSVKVLMRMGQFMFSDAWEVYSFRKFYERIITLSHQLLNDLEGTISG